MKDYTSKNPDFSETIKILETSDPGHADIINEALKQLLKNTLSLKSSISTLNTEFAPQFHYSNTNNYTTGYYKIKIKSTKQWMLHCMVMLYQGYVQYALTISGYNYGDQHWYLPEAAIASTSKGSSGFEVRFGYDADGFLWFAVPAASYTGLTICNINNGYVQESDWANMFTCTYESTLTGTLQNVVTAACPTMSFSVRDIAVVSALPADAASHTDTLYIIPA